VSQAPSNVWTPALVIEALRGASGASLGARIDSLFGPSARAAWVAAPARGELHDITGPGNGRLSESEAQDIARNLNERHVPLSVTPAPKEPAPPCWGAAQVLAKLRSKPREMGFLDRLRDCFGAAHYEELAAAYRAAPARGARHTVDNGSPVTDSELEAIASTLNNRRVPFSLDAAPVTGGWTRENALARLRGPNGEDGFGRIFGVGSDVARALENAYGDAVRSGKPHVAGRCVYYDDELDALARALNEKGVPSPAPSLTAGADLDRSDSADKPEPKTTRGDILAAMALGTGNDRRERILGSFGAAGPTVMRAWHAADAVGPLHQVPGVAPGFYDLELSAMADALDRHKRAERTGVLGALTPSSNVATSVVILADKADAYLFEKGQRVGAQYKADSNGGRALRSGFATIKSVNYSNGTLAIEGNWSAAIPAIAAGDELVRAEVMRDVAADRYHVVVPAQRSGKMAMLRAMVDAELATGADVYLSGPGYTHKVQPGSDPGASDAAIAMAYAAAAVSIAPKANAKAVSSPITSSTLVTAEQIERHRPKGPHEGEGWCGCTTSKPPRQADTEATAFVCAECGGFLRPDGCTCGVPYTLPCSPPPKVPQLGMGGTEGFYAALLEGLDRPKHMAARYKCDPQDETGRPSLAKVSP
jgi:hypothetical protein